jgi:hypothetical protein
VNTLREVYRGRAADELILVDTDGRAILLRGDGLTEDERIRMRERAFAVLSGGVMTPEQHDNARHRAGNAEPGVSPGDRGRPGPQPERRGALSLPQRLMQTQGSSGAARAVRLNDVAAPVVTSKPQQGTEQSGASGT